MCYWPPGKLPGDLYNAHNQYPESNCFMRRTHKNKNPMSEFALVRRIENLREN